MVRPSAPYALVLALFAAACSGSDASGDLSSRACATTNACGGCTPLGERLGERCGDASKLSFWACDGPDAVACFEAGPPRNVQASTEDPHSVHIAWSPPEKTSPSGYVLLRDGARIAVLDGGAWSFDDLETGPGSLGPPRLVSASQGTWAGGVRVSWSRPEGIPGEAHSYAVGALYGRFERFPDAPPAIGQRAPPWPSGYEIRIGEGAWLAAGMNLSYEDVTAPRGTLLGTAEATEDLGSTSVRLHAGVTAGDAPATVGYRVRAQVGADRTDPSETAFGRRAIGHAVRTQWQRSSGDADADYSDLPSVTGLDWYDENAPIDGTAHYYRALIETEGAVGITTSARGRTRGFAEVVTIGNNMCGLLVTDRSLLCWGSSPLAITQGAPFSKIFRGEDRVCVLKESDSHAVCRSLHGDAPLPPSDVAFDKLFLNRQCGLTTESKVVCWGGVPSAPADEVLKAFASNDLGGCGLRAADGSVVCWGYDGIAPESRPTPPADLLEDIIDEGPASFCGRRISDHHLVCWTGGGSLRVYDEPLKDLIDDEFWGPWCILPEASGRPVCYGGFIPSYILPSQTYTKLESLIHGTLCARRALDGRRRCWGSSYFQVVDSGGTFLGDRWYGCMLRDDQRLRCEGHVGYYSQPSVLSPAEPFVRVFGRRSERICAVRASDGTLSCPNPRYYEDVPPGFGAIGTAALHEGSMCVTRASDHVVSCWQWDGPAPMLEGAFSFLTYGPGFYGMAGIRESDGAIVPADSLAPPGPFRAVAYVGTGYSANGCAIRAEDGKAVCWGYSGVLGPTADAFDVVAPTSGGMCGIRSKDSRLVCLGPAPFDVPSFPISQFAGSCVVRKEDGLKICAPYAEPDFADPVISLSSDASCVVRYDGHLWCD